jgi:hypothetical protein
MHDAPIKHHCIRRMNLASPSPKVMPHETPNVAVHHPLALHCVPRSHWRIRGPFSLSLA